MARFSKIVFALTLLATAVPTVFAGSGVWINLVSGGLWSASTNWTGGIIADGSGTTASFASIDVTNNNTVHLDGSRTLTSLTFGDTQTATPGGWILDNNGNNANILTLAGPNPNITVNTLAAGSVVTIGAQISGTTAWSKAGGGALYLTGSNTFDARITVSGSSSSLYFNSISEAGSGIPSAFGQPSTAANGQINIGSSSYLFYNGTTPATTARTVVFTGSNGQIRNVSPNGSTLTLNGVITNSASGGGSVVFRGTSDVVLNGPLYLGGFYLYKVDGGTLTITSSNNFTGGVNVGAGTFLVNNLTGSGTGSGTVTVASGATFGGTGSVSGNVVFNSGANASFTVGSPMTIGGNLTLSNNTVYVNLPVTPTNGTYTLATYNISGTTGSLAPTPVVVSGSLPVGINAVVNAVNGVISLTLSGNSMPGLSVIPVGDSFWSLIAASWDRQSLMTVGTNQYIAYYNEHTNVVVGVHALGSTNWTLNPTTFLPSVYKADGSVDPHDTVNIGMGSDGYLHCAWGMHASPLNYARGDAPYSLNLIQTNMTGGVAENTVTYPNFINLPNGDVLFLFRDGTAGAGNTVLNRWSSTTHSWTNVHYGGGQKPFIAGKNSVAAGLGYVSAYPNYPMLDYQTNLVLTWCWRVGANQLNQDTMYARSPDFGKTWQNWAGANYSLPIYRTNAEVIWPISTNQSLMNQCGLAIDTNNRPVTCTYWAPGGPGTPIQYMLIWNDGTAWRTNQIGNRTSINNPGRPQIVCDRQNNLFMLFSDSNPDSQPSIGWCTSTNRSQWNFFPFTTDCAPGWETSFDPIRWQRDNILDFVYKRGTTLPHQLSVYEFNPAAFLTNVPALSNYTWTNNASGNWSVAANWTNSFAPTAGGSNSLSLTFGGVGGYTANNNLSGNFGFNQLTLDSSGTGTNYLTGNPWMLNNFLTVHPSLLQTGSVAVVISNNLTASDDLSIALATTAPVTLRGNLSCGGGLTMTGSGQLILSGVNSINGAINLTGGTLSFGNTGLPGSGQLSLYGGILQWLPGSTANILSGRTSRTYGPVVFDPNGNTVTLSGSSGASGGLGGLGSLIIGGTNGGTIILNQANSYAGPTVINSGTLALGAAGSISGSSAISIAAGATFDVSAVSAFVWSTNTDLNASGTGTVAGTNAAAIKGAVSGTVNLSSQPITLIYDGLHPALHVSQGTLVLNSNAFTVNTTVPLSPGTYPIVQQAGGSITDGGGNTVSGTALGSAFTGSISVTGGTVNLVIVPIPVPQYFRYSAATNIWNNSSNFWSLSSGGPYNTNWTNYNSPTFEGSGGTVTISGASVNCYGSLNFKVNNYTLAASNPFTLNLTGTAFSINNTNALSSCFISAPIVTDPGSILSINSSIGNTAVVLLGSNSIGGQIDIAQGKVLLNHANVLTGCSGVTVGNGGSLQVGNQNNFNISGIPVSITGSGVNGGASALQGFSSSTCGWGGPVTLAGSSSIGARVGVFNVSGVISDGGAGYAVAINNQAGVYGSGTVNLSGTNTYSGQTRVAGGTLQVNGSMGNGAVIVSNSATLGGNGLIRGPVTVQSGGTLAPGANGTGTLTISNALAFQAGSTNWMEINGSTLTGDQVGGLTSITYGGTLIVTNVGDTSALTNGASITLFSATTYNASFSSSNLPPLGSNLAWDTSSLVTNGTLRVKSTVIPVPVITSVQVNGGNLIMQGTNGLPGSTYSILTATNVSLPIALWPTNSTGNFSGSGWFSNALPMNSSEPQRYYLLKAP